MSAPHPVSAAAFAEAMEGCGPFPDRPQIAVALSGGPDSMALTLLADRWARDRGGRVMALTVDHGLRPESAAEAAMIARWMAARDIPHEILRWDGAKPARAIQAAAREARYALLARWCRAHNILYLLVAHHAGDQAETVAMREARRSGAPGLAGMSPVAPPPVPGPRWPLLLRPLLGFTREELSATLRAAGADWIEDPSNRNPAFTRVAIRDRLGRDPKERLRLGSLAARARRMRDHMDMALAARAADAVTLDPAGFAVVDRRLFADLPDTLLRHFWARMLITIAGAVYPPRGAGLDRLVGAARDSGFRGATLHGCRITAGPRRLTVAREYRAAPKDAPYADGMLWDGRFTLRGQAPAGAVVRPLGRLRPRDAAWLDDLPASAAMTYPALFVDENLIAVPRLVPAAQDAAEIVARFTPRIALFP